jgi:hypothetical protein
MGAFYSNIHLRTTDRAAVKAAWEGYWCEQGETSHAWVSPPYDGWTTLFDWHTDQIEPDTLRALAAFVSEHTGCTGLAFQVQDSMLAEYWLFNKGREVDHYTSNNEYVPTFAPQSPDADPEGTFDGFGPDIHAFCAGEADLTDGGNTSLLLALTGARVPDVALEAILRSPADIADDILTALASAVGINDTWAAVGYHYLSTEGDIIPGMTEFHHLPANAPPRKDGVSEH